MRLKQQVRILGELFRCVKVRRCEDQLAASSQCVCVRTLGRAPGTLFTPFFADISTLCLLFIIIIIYYHEKYKFFA
jgi:hypothetical protein